jgi:hypothetical protein
MLFTNNKEKIKRIIHNLGELYNLDNIEKMAEKNLFIRRKLDDKLADKYKGCGIKSSVKI